MKCFKCNLDGNLTVRDGSDNLHNCCMSCYKSSREEIVDKQGNIQPNPHRLWISCVWKDGGEHSEFNERHNHRVSVVDTSDKRYTGAMARLYLATDGII